MESRERILGMIGYHESRRDAGDLWAQAPWRINQEALKPLDAGIQPTHPGLSSTPATGNLTVHGPHHKRRKS